MSSKFCVPIISSKKNKKKKKTTLKLKKKAPVPVEKGTLQI